jgi:hypothetical protein
MVRRDLILQISRQKIKFNIKSEQGPVEFDSRTIVALSCFSLLSGSM